MFLTLREYNNDGEIPWESSGAVAQHTDIHPGVPLQPIVSVRPTLPAQPTDSAQPKVPMQRRRNSLESMAIFATMNPEPMDAAEPNYLTTLRQWLVTPPSPALPLSATT